MTMGLSQICFLGITDSLKMNKTTTIEVLIIAKNEAKYIEASLRSALLVGPVCVVDTGSTDETVDIALRMGARVVHHDFVTFKVAREFALAQSTADFVMFLDADEVIPQALATRILQFVTTDEGELLLIPRKNLLLGEWVRHSMWYPDHQSRVVRRDLARFQSQWVHERLVDVGRVIWLPEHHDLDLIHRTCDDVGAYFGKIHHYTTLEAQQYLGSHPFKLTAMGIFTRSFGMFTQTLFHHKGLRDGKNGFIVAVFNFVYSLMMMTKLWALEEKQRRDTL